MRKNFSQNFSDVEVDPITGEYLVRIPEWIINEMGWYEETPLEWVVEGDELILREKIND